MSATSGGGRGRGRGTGTGKDTGNDRQVIGMGRGKGRQITTPPPSAPSVPPSTVPPEIEEMVRAQQAEMKGVIKMCALCCFYELVTSQKLPNNLKITVVLWKERTALASQMLLHYPHRNCHRLQILTRTVQNSFPEVNNLKTISPLW